MARRSIKGAGFQSVVADLVKLRDSEGITQDELEARLPADDLALLEEKMNPAGWYDLGAYERFMEILIEREGGSDPTAYLHRRGAALCERLIAAGTYAQLEIVERMDDDRKRERLLKDVRLITTIYSALLDFATLHADNDPELGIYLEITDAADFPETLRIVITGVMTFLSQRISPELPGYTSERVTDDRIRFERLR
ncbi:MAG: hypothetical protein ACE5FL_09230 [Myxococcota bacterium]